MSVYQPPLDRIRQYCADWHDMAKCNYGKNPYVIHLDMVVSFARLIGEEDYSFLQACYGHDILEDTKVTAEVLRIYGFTEEAITLIDLVTNKPGKNRQERHTNTYPAIAANDRARKLKICDRMANISFTFITENYRLLDMYSKEHPAFLSYFFRVEDSIEVDKLWDRMEKMLEF